MIKLMTIPSPSGPSVTGVKSIPMYTIITAVPRINGQKHHQHGEINQNNVHFAPHHHHQYHRKEARMNRQKDYKCILLLFEASLNC